MVSAKILVLALVVATAAATPTPTLGLAAEIIGGALNAVGNVIGKPWIPKWRHDDKPGTRHIYAQGECPLEPFGYLANGVTDLAGNVVDILRDLVQLRFPATFDDAINAVISVARVAAGIVNVVIPGLGSLLGNIIIAVAKIVICVLGSPGITGAVLGDRRGGYGNSRDIPAICLNNYGHKYGWQAYDGGYDSPKDVVDFYNLGNCKYQVNALIRKATRGKGLSGLSDSDRIIAELALKISELLSRANKSDWSQKDIEELSVNVAIMIGVIGNGYSNGYGADLIESLFDFVRPSFKSIGLDLSGREGEIKKKISNCRIYDFGGALRNHGGSSGGSFGHNESSSGNSGNNESSGGNSGRHESSSGNSGYHGSSGGSSGRHESSSGNSGYNGSSGGGSGRHESSSGNSGYNGSSGGSSGHQETSSGTSGHHGSSSGNSSHNGSSSGNSGQNESTSGNSGHHGSSNGSSAHHESSSGNSGTSGSSDNSDSSSGSSSRSSSADSSGNNSNSNTSGNSDNSNNSSDSNNSSNSNSCENSTASNNSGRYADSSNANSSSNSSSDSNSDSSEDSSGYSNDGSYSSSQQNSSSKDKSDSNSSKNSASEESSYTSKGNADSTEDC